jgi:hypothetical protein
MASETTSFKLRARAEKSDIFVITAAYFAEIVCQTTNVASIFCDSLILCAPHKE